MWWAYVYNVILAFIMLTTMLFCIGDLDSALSADDPYLQLLQNTGSTVVALLLSVILFLLVFSGDITALATTSRETWAFSRDQGSPFSKWISRIGETPLSLTNNSTNSNAYRWTVPAMFHSTLFI